MEANSVILWRRWQARLLQQLEEPPHHREILWITDKVGGSGKSFLASYLVMFAGAIKFKADKSADVKFAYSGQRIAIFDIPRDKFCKVSYTAMDSIKNGIFFSPKFHSKMKVYPIPWVVVFSNHDPDLNKISQDRFKVYDIGDEESQASVGPFLPSYLVTHETQVCAQEMPPTTHNFQSVAIYNDSIRRSPSSSHTIAPVPVAPSLRISDVRSALLASSGHNMFTEHVGSSSLVKNVPPTSVSTYQQMSSDYSDNYPSQAGHWSFYTSWSGSSPNNSVDVNMDSRDADYLSNFAHLHCYPVVQTRDGPSLSNVSSSPVAPTCRQVVQTNLESDDLIAARPGKNNQRRKRKRGPTLSKYQTKTLKRQANERGLSGSSGSMLNVDTEIRLPHTSSPSDVHFSHSPPPAPTPLAPAPVVPPHPSASPPQYRPPSPRRPLPPHQSAISKRNKPQIPCLSTSSRDTNSYRRADSEQVVVMTSNLSLHSPQFSSSLRSVLYHPHHSPSPLAPPPSPIFPPVPTRARRRHPPPPLSTPHNRPTSISSPVTRPAPAPTAADPAAAGNSLIPF